MRRVTFPVLALAAAFAATGAPLPAARQLVATAPSNLVTPGAISSLRDPVARFAAVIAATDFAHRSDIAAAHTRLESEIDAEIDHRRANGSRLSKIELKELSDARSMLRSSLGTLMSANEDGWERARRQAQLTLETLRLAYFALQPQQLAWR